LLNYAQIRSQNQPVLSNQGDVFLLNETTGAFDVVETDSTV